METVDYIPNQKSPSVFQFAIKWALILGLLEIAVWVALYLTNSIQNGGGMYSWLPYIFMFGIAIFAVMNFRDKESGGFISFGKGFSVSFFIILFAAIICSIYTFIFFKFISPETIDQILRFVQQTMIDKGMPDSQVEAAMKVTKIFMNPTGMAIGGLIKYVLGGTILSLIVAAICKKENNMLLPPQ